MNRPSGTILDVYYKIIEDGQDLKFDDIAYRLSATDVTDTADEEPSIFRERQHTISGLNAFSTIAVKLVFKSSNSAYVPQVKNLRVLTEISFVGKPIKNPLSSISCEFLNFSFFLLNP